MRIVTLASAGYSSNSYLVIDDESRSFAVVDPSNDPSAADEFFSAGYSLKYVLLTHGHFDHILFVDEWRERGGSVCIHSGDADFLGDPAKSLYLQFFARDIKHHDADIILNDGDKLFLGESEIFVINTPGHTKGSVCYLFDDTMISGDTLFYGGVGRTDLYGSSYDDLVNSLCRLDKIEKDYVVYPGHGVKTTLSKEKTNIAKYISPKKGQILMDFEKLAELLFPDVNRTPESLEEEFPVRDLPDGAIVSRMAPSPTGFVHLGNLVQGITSERLSHQSNGVLFLRVEDTDSKREVPGAVEVLISSLAHYGINFDEGATADGGDSGIYGPYRQRMRRDIYHVYAKKLVGEGKAYPCFCTEEELSDIHARQEAEKANFGYYGKWAKYRDASFETIEQNIKNGMPWVLRFHSEGSIEHKIKFTDLIKGNLELTENDIDHVLLKSDGIPTYHFAHAVDDHLMRTTHVVRGDEWLPTLPFHLQLFNALGWRAPKYLHIGPLMKMDGESKRKLSKRKDPELALTFYREEGYPVEAVYEYILTVLNSNYEDWRRANPFASTNEFKFSYKKMNPAGSLFDGDKLRDVSKDVISRMDADRVYTLAAEYAKEYDTDFFEKLTSAPEYAKEILSIGRGGKKPRKDFAVWSELKPYMSFFYDDYFTYEAAMPDFAGEDIRNILTDYADIYDMADDQNVWFDKIKALSAKYGFCPDTKEYKANPDAYKGHVGDVSMILRVAVTGRQNSPDMYSVMHILGKERVLARLEAAKKLI